MLNILFIGCDIEDACLLGVWMIWWDECKPTISGYPVNNQERLNKRAQT